MTKDFETGKPALKELAPIVWPGGLELHPFLARWAGAWPHRSAGQAEICPTVLQGRRKFASIIPLRRIGLELASTIRQGNPDWAQWADTKVGGCN